MSSLDLKAPPPEASTAAIQGAFHRLKLTSEQILTIYRAARPLLAPDREGFYAAVAEQLAEQREVGDGALHRAIASAQRRFEKPDPEWSRE